MDAVFLRSSPDQQVSPYKQHMRNLPPPNFRGGPLLAPPPPFLFHSYPSPVSLPNQPPPPQQPPLLPLPLPMISRPYNMNSWRSRGLSCPPINRKWNGNSRGKSQTPEKSSKLSTSSPKKKEPKYASLKSTKVNTISSNCIIESTNYKFGHNPKDLPEEVSRALSLSSSSSSAGTVNCDDDIVTAFVAMEKRDKFSGSVVFTVSPPPPSSLPLPTFSLRPKLSCKAEAAAIDAGATDNLRRLLRLR